MRVLQQYFLLVYIGLMSKVFASGPEDQGSIPGRVIPKTQKMVLDSALLNTQHYKVRIKGKEEQSREWSSTPPYFNVVAIEKGAIGEPSTKIAKFTILAMLNLKKRMQLE